MSVQRRIDHITGWIRDYADAHAIKSLVVGVSGGIDSSVVSALCARTGITLHAISMPIRQRPELHDLSQRHGHWLADQWPQSVVLHTVDLTGVFDRFAMLWDQNHDLALANTRSRLRMVTLYHVAQTTGGIVVGTGNKIEDFGVGFFTKYGDGGVDISPIGDCTKTQVWEMGRALGILPDIVDAAPTDGLWDDGRTDQDQLGGMTYAQLEEAMSHDVEGTVPADHHGQVCLDLYRSIRRRALHKMRPIPVCRFDTVI